MANLRKITIYIAFNSLSSRIKSNIFGHFSKTGIEILPGYFEVIIYFRKNHYFFQLFEKNNNNLKNI